MTRRALATATTAAVFTITGATPAAPATYPTATICNVNGGTVWFRTWSGRVATTGVHKGQWPLYGWMAGGVVDPAKNLRYIPKSMSLGGQARSVVGVQVTWIPAAYVAPAQAKWTVSQITSGMSWTATCTNPPVRHR